MGKNSPIGLFDSGVGGLTVAHALHTILPSEDLVYFGDTARVPYGTKGEQTVLAFARQGDTTFVSKEVTPHGEVWEKEGKVPRDVLPEEVKVGDPLRAQSEEQEIQVWVRELNDVILPPFEMAVRLGGAGSVMNSYADLDGIPAAADWLAGKCVRK